jgi:methylglutaconyl-CoA hydratase
MNYQYLLVESGCIKGKVVPGLCVVTLNRSNVHNALNDELITELCDLVDRLGNDDTTRCMVLRGAGRSFCAGADINEMRNSREISLEENMARARKLALCFKALNSLSCPLVTVVQGSTFGGGVGLVAVSDFVIADSSARFAFSEVKLGILPAVISPYVISKIGESNARAYFLSGCVFTVSEALRMSLVHKVVAGEDELVLALDSIVSDIFKSSPGAIKSTKLLISSLRGSKDYVEDTLHLLSKARVSRDGQEGLSAFIEKRSPDWWVE